MSWQIWASKILLVALGSVATAVYTKNVVAKLKPGAPRLLAALPVLALYISAPFIFDAHSELMSRASTAAMLLWLASFKVLLLCGCRGPLAAAQRQGLTLGQWTALQVWPILHREGPNGEVMLCPEATPRERRRRALQRALKRVPENVMIAMVGGLTLVAPPVPLFIKTYSAAFGVSAWCGLWANAMGGLVLWLHGLEPALSWDRPWLQTSLNDFWTRRWNLPAAYSLRSLVFEPILQGTFVARTPVSPPPAPAREPMPKAARETHTPPPSDCSPVADTVQSTANVEGSDGHEEHTNGSQEPGAGAGDASTRGAAAPAGPTDTGLSSMPASQLRKRAVAGAADAGSDGLAAAAEAPLLGAPAAVQAPRKTRVPTSTRLIALASTFAVSGMMHEVLLLVCTGWAAAAPRLGVQMLYFMLQVPLSLAEGALVRVMKANRVMPPSILCIPVASLTLQVPALYLFWNPIFEAATAAMAQQHNATTS